MTLLKQDYIMLIFNCEKYRFKALKQKETWLQSLPSYLIYYHVIGSPLINKDYDFDEANRVLRVNTEDDYNSLPKKVYAAYKAINETYEFKYIFKTDDDQMLNNARVFDMILGLIAKEKSLNNFVHYGGNIVDIKIPYISKYNLIHSELPTSLIMQKTKYCSGRFYLLSFVAITYLLRKKEEICKEYFEDYAIGYNLNDAFKANMLQINTNIFFIDMPDVL